MNSPSLRLFIKNAEIEEIPNLDKIGIFDLLGSNLKELVQNLCEKKGCVDSPVIDGDVHPTAVIEGAVYVAKGAKVGPQAYIQGPTYICSGADVRHAAFIRGSVFVGKNAVVGHTTEAKGSIFFPEAKAGHFAYVGDSILGFNVNLGAGTKLANLKLKGNEVRYKDPESGELHGSGLRKFGAVIGDHAQCGCNSVISPGSLIMPEKFILPCQHFHGTLK